MTGYFMPELAVGRKMGSWYTRSMKTLVKSVKDMEAAERSTIERIVGERLEDNQRLFIRITDDLQNAVNSKVNGKVESELPEWCNIYEGLSTHEVEKLSDSIMRVVSNRSMIST